MRKKQPLILFIAIVIYLVFFFMLCVLKYSSFQYQEIDLAIFNQVFYNLSQNFDLYSSIQQQNYFGDHFSPFIFLLLPFYYLYLSPLTLLFLQTLFLGLSAIPVYLIAKTKLKNNNLALIISLIFLAYPALHSVNLYEFSLLSFAPFFLFFTFYFLIKQRLLYFYIFIFLSLLIREDIAFIIALFGIYALIKKSSLKWILPPILVSIIWFILSLKAISHFNPENHYKYLIHYSWLGDNLQEIIINFFIHFPQVILHFLSLENLVFIFYLFLPVLFLPIFGKLTLIFFIPPFLQFGLANSGFGGIFFTHYLALFIPFVFISAIYGISLMPSLIKRMQSQIPFRLGQKEKYLAFIILIFTIIACNIGFSPSYNLPKRLNKLNQNLIQIKNNFIAKISNCPCQSVLTTNDFLPHLSNRENLYSTVYVIKGNKQYSNQKYKIKNLNYALINYEQFYQSCQTQKKISSNKKLCQQAIKKLDKIFQQNKLFPQEINDNIILYNQKKAAPNKLKALQAGEKEVKLKLSQQNFNVYLDESSLEKISKE